MRADLPATIAAAIERQLARNRPALIFDKARIAANMRVIADAAHAHDIRVLFAAKSFPHPIVWNLAAEHFDGFDVASVGELATVPDARIISIADPTGQAGSVTRARVDCVSHDELLVEQNAHRRIASESATQRVIVACETPARVAAAPADADIAIRISASITGTDPAVGAILDGSGHRRSRFGIDRSSDSDRQERQDRPGQEQSERAVQERAEQEGPRPEVSLELLREMARAAEMRRVGLHLHHGPVTATNGERFLASARAAIAFAAEAGISPAFIDLGGAWHGIADFATAFAHVRAGIDAALGSSIEILIEPGRAVVHEAGFACGHVVAARSVAGRELRIVDISRLCHLRWSPVELVGAAPHAGTGVHTVVLGPTCSEEDAVGEWTVAPSMLDEGAPIILRGVTGYSAAWNSAFGGVPPATIAIV
ncbi:MAG TPA: hypothetical protein VGM39_11320 [Kofleriaceae bacterium]